jgi:hypothetical protein
MVQEKMKFIEFKILFWLVLTSQGQSDSRRTCDAPDTDYGLYVETSFWRVGIWTRVDTILLSVGCIPRRAPATARLKRQGVKLLFFGIGTK